MPTLEKLISELETVDAQIEISYHARRRAKQRNVDIKHLKRKLKQLEIEEVKINHDNDPRFEKTYKILIKKNNNTYYQMPIHFNMHGQRIYVKSVWKK